MMVEMGDPARVALDEAGKAMGGSAGRSAAEEAAAFLAANPAVETIQAILVDIHGKARGKSVRRDKLAGLLESGVTLPNAPFSCDVWGKEMWQTGLVYETGDKDNACLPIPGTLKLQPWSEGRAAQVLVRPFTPEGAPNPVCPRTRLDEAVAAVGAHGLRPTVAFELEFYLFKATPDSAPRPLDIEDGREGPRRAGIYGIDEMDRARPFLDLVARYAEALGVPADAALSEGGPGQFEINLLHREDPMRAADDAFLFRRIVHAAAETLGLRASFMPKPLIGQPGSGMHVHVSMRGDDGRNAFVGAEGQVRLERCIAGMLATMRDVQLIFSPGANGYRRTRWPVSPANTITWGYDNRITALRIPNGPDAARRFEHRTPGADANPYLALAAMLYGCAEGLDRRLEPPKAATGTAEGAGAKRQHREMFDAWQAFAQSAFARTRFGKPFHKAFTVVKEYELSVMEGAISPLEYEAYL